MDKLCYQTLKEQKYDGFLLEHAPEKVLQFGEGNFLRAFVDYFFDILNEKAGFNGKIVMVQPIPGGDEIRQYINEQEGLYTLLLRGSENGEKRSVKRVISSVSRCLNPYSEYDTYMACAHNPNLRYITCNTTEAGIQYVPECKFEDRPASSYPGKLTQFLYERFQTFGQISGKGFIILSCELIDDNGQVLKDCVLKYARQWELSEDFIHWIENENLFCSTLVDRIVTGYPRSDADELCKTFGYEDYIIDTGEIFGFWVIEGPDALKEELPFAKAGLPVLVCKDHKPYKQRKVRILNGAHTSMVLGAYLAGKEIVRECMQDPVICDFMSQTIYQEIIPTLTLPHQELLDFAQAVKDRFNNPFIDHALLSISLNSTAKWKARVLPSLDGYYKKYDKPPVCISASLACYLAFYQVTRTDGGSFYGSRKGNDYPIHDDADVLAFFEQHNCDSEDQLVPAVLGQTTFWGTDLNTYPGFTELVTQDLKLIHQEGTYALMQKCLAASE